MKKIIAFFVIFLLSLNAQAYLDDWEIVPTLPGDCLYDEETGRYADENGTIYDNLSEYMESMGYTYYPDARIWSDSEGFYYEDSWVYMSWEEAEEVAEENGVYICPDCEEVVYERESHLEECGAERTEQEGTEEHTQGSPKIFLACAFLIAAVFCTVHFLRKRG